jgi:hypothetical protein
VGKVVVGAGAAGCWAKVRLELASTTLANNFLIMVD